MISDLQQYLIDWTPRAMQRKYRDNVQSKSLCVDSSLWCDGEGDQLTLNTIIKKSTIFIILWNILRFGAIAFL